MLAGRRLQLAGPHAMRAASGCLRGRKSGAVAALNVPCEYVQRVVAA